MNESTWRGVFLWMALASFAGMACPAFGADGIEGDGVLEADGALEADDDIEILDWHGVPIPGPGQPPPWRAKFEEAQTLMGEIFMARQMGETPDTARTFGQVEAIAEDPDFPPAQTGQLLYMLGMMAQDFDEHAKAIGYFNRIVELAESGAVEPPAEAALLMGLGLANRAELEYTFMDRPLEAIALFERALAIEILPAEFRSTVLTRQLQVRLIYEACFDPVLIIDLARRQMVWSVYEGRGGGVGTDARLPGHWAAAMALNGMADEARALLALCQEREVSVIVGEMALSLAFAHGALGDAEGAALWLERDLNHVAHFRAPSEFDKHMDRVAAAHVLREVIQDEAIQALLASWRARSSEAAAAGDARVVSPEAMFGDFGFEDM